MLTFFRLVLPLWLLVIASRPIGTTETVTVQSATLDHKYYEWTNPSEQSSQIRLEESSSPVSSNLVAGNTVWHTDRFEADHQNDIDTLIPQGYRLISLHMVAFATSGPLYNTAWNKSPGPIQQTTIGMNASAFDDWYGFWVGQGYAPMVVAGTGVPNGVAPNNMYAAVMERRAVGSFYLLRDQTFADLVAADAQRGAAGQRDRRWFASRRQDNLVWGYKPGGSLDPANAELEKPNWRPSCLPKSFSTFSGLRQSGIFTDTYLGRWNFTQNTSSNDIQILDQGFTNDGLQMIYLAGFGDILNAIWAEKIEPVERLWNAEGSTTGFRDNSRSQDQLDNLAKSFMVQNGVRHAQLAIGKNGQILMERAYSWTESGRYQAQPTDKMLLASLSKMFCAAAIQTLLDAGKLTLQTRPWTNFRGSYPWNGKPGSGPLSFVLRFATVQQLLDHQAGWDRSKTPDQIFQMRQASSWLQQSTPPTISEFIDWITTTQRLDFSPGSDSQYSNVGYLALSAVVEHVTGMAYFDYLDSAVLAPLGLSGSVKVYETNMVAHVDDGLTQESIFTGLSVLSPSDPSTLTPNVFGGDGLYKETAVGPSSLAASASSIVKFMNSHSVWGNGPRCNRETTFPPDDAPLGNGNPCNREGSLDGSRGWAESRSDGLD